MGTTMMNLRRAGLIAVVALLADSRAVLAQTPSQSSGGSRAAYFGRTTTGRRDPTPLSSQGVRVARSGATASAGASPSVSRTSRSTNELQPYSAEAERLAQSQAPAGSSWQQEPKQAVRTPEVVPRTQSHNYYRDRRPGRTVQPPVTLTARQFGYPGAGGICTPSRSQASATSSAGAHHR